MEGRRRKKKPLSRLAKTFLSYALIAALALPPQAAWATIPEGTMDEDGALAIGVDSSAGHMCTSVGSNALAGLQSSTFGYQANAEGTYSSAFGYQANAYATNSVALVANSVASEAYTVSVGGNGTTRRIVNVAEGTADTDAATVGQLASLGSEVARIVGGQGLTYDGKSFTGALFNIGGKDYYTIERALNELYNGTAGSTGGAVGGDEIVIDPGNGAVTIAGGKNIKISEMKGQYVIDVSESPTFSAVYAGRADIGGITVGSDGINMGDKKITGLAEGELGANSTDAVTGGQLYGLGESVSKALVGDGSAFADGKITAGIKVGDQTYDSVQAALNAVSTGGGTAVGNAVQYDDEGDATMAPKGNDGGAEKLTGLAEGEITAGSTDAVTGGQLYTTNENIKTVSDSLGESVSKALGGTSAFADGKVTVGIEVGGTTYASVQEALNAVNTGGGTAAANAVQYDDDSKTSVTLNKSGDAVKLTNIADGKDDLDAVNKRQLDAVQGQVDVHKTTLEKHETTLNEHTVMIENHEEQFTTLQTVLGDTYSSPSFSSITVGNIYSDGTNINMGGGTITGLADGSIAPGSTDAVTGGQLWNAYKRMDDLNESINIVGAHAAALSGLHPIQYNPYEPTTLSAAVGTYRDEYAVAVGVFHYVRSNVLFNLGASICSDGDVMGRAGVSLAVGKGGRKKPELARDMVGMQQQMIAMQAMLEELKEENAKNKETIKKNEETIKELKEALGKKK